jgi:hypothetical protein
MPISDSCFVKTKALRLLGRLSTYSFYSCEVKAVSLPRGTNECPLARYVCRRSLEDLDPEQLDNYLASLKVLIETEEAKVEAQKQLPAPEQTVDLVPAEVSGEQNK